MKSIVRCEILKIHERAKSISTTKKIRPKYLCEILRASMTYINISRWKMACFRHFACIIKRNWILAKIKEILLTTYF